ncbi:protein STAY-GREEN homolog, chloroplastic [Dendrobium catenatum]|uniref:Staygreen protein domain-containing protein n=1 Tax=Dendrobium nobile TaxID=94219 RepID=A0A8T3AZ39_DENNO|nr:protein STAY-GREEN homolog, chloroplastic [Dendrobium catenatum]KAI0499455.1 hypothetical protein KFK09_020358 [Dendrobium nobile]
MGSAAALLPTPAWQHQPSSSSRRSSISRRRIHPGRRSIFPVARLFGPAIFEASKLKVMFLGVDDRKHPEKLPRTYTLTHSDVTARLTLAISQSINRAQLQGWYHKLQRDEVVAEWRKVRGKMSLHVHCHISGGHFLLDLVANLRHHIFSRELPVVLKAFVHGDGGLFRTYPDLEDALVWVYFHSNSPDLHSVECWGPLRQAAEIGRPEKPASDDFGEVDKSWPTPHQRCQTDCDCCFPLHTLIPWPTAQMKAGEPQ